MNDYNYYNDHRVRANLRNPLFTQVDEVRMRGTIVVYDDDDEFSVQVPIRMEVCPTCDGKGKHANPSVDCDGLTAEDFRDDPDLEESYRNGRYDVSCYGCHGNRVTPVIDRDNATPEELTWIGMKDASEEEDRQFEAMQASERSMGA